MTFLAALLNAIAEFFRWKREDGIRAQGRQELINESKEALDERIKISSSLDSVSDPARDDRLRDRFDRSRRPK